MKMYVKTKELGPIGGGVHPACPPPPHRSANVVDPGFPMGEVDLMGNVDLPTRALFSENVCENERIGSCRGHALGKPPRSANA